MKIIEVGASEAKTHSSQLLREAEQGSIIHFTRDELRGIEADLAALPFVTDPLPDAYTRQRIREPALEKRLTYSGASYVELAGHLQLPLRSFDRKTIRAMS